MWTLDVAAAESCWQLSLVSFNEGWKWNGASFRARLQSLAEEVLQALSVLSRACAGLWADSKGKDLASDPQAFGAESRTLAFWLCA